MAEERKNDQLPAVEGNQNVADQQQPPVVADIDANQPRRVERPVQNAERGLRAPGVQQNNGRYIDLQYQQPQDALASSIAFAQGLGVERPQIVEISNERRMEMLASQDLFNNDINQIASLINNMGIRSVAQRASTNETIFNSYRDQFSRTQLNFLMIVMAKQGKKILQSNTYRSLPVRIRQIGREMGIEFSQELSLMMENQPRNLLRIHIFSHLRMGKTLDKGAMECVLTFPSWRVPEEMMAGEVNHIMKLRMDAQYANSFMAKVVIVLNGAQFSVNNEHYKNHIRNHPEIYNANYMMSDKGQRR